MSTLFGGNKTAQAQQQTIYTGIQLQTSTYGPVVPIVYGQTRVAGNIIWYGAFSANEVNSSGGSSGKGGSLGGSSGGKSYTYSASFAMGVCEGPVVGILNVWTSPTAVTLSSLGLTALNGTYPQTPWGYLTTFFPGQNLPYPGIAYVVAQNYNLGSSPNLPNFNFEVAGISHGTYLNGYDSDPSQVFYDFLTNVNYGVGFPSAKMGSLATYQQYCMALGIGISPKFDTQTDAASSWKDIFTATNSEAVWSDGVLTVVPYGDQAISGNGYTYTPPSAPLYSLNDDDFLSDGGSTDPVSMTRSRAADQINDIQFEFLNRGMWYNVETVETKDQSCIEAYGLRNTNSFQGHFICDSTMAATAATLMLHRQYVRNTYEFTLGWRYILLDPMDIIAITDVALGLNNQWVRITNIEEDDNGNLKVTAEEYLAGTGSSALYSFQQSSRVAANYNVSPGNANAPAIFEVPGTYTGITNLEVWVGTSGGANWGGADVWISQDGTSYTHQAKITASARYGVLTASLPASPVTTGYLDSTSTLAINLSASGASVAGSTAADALAFNTMALVGSGTTAELVGYQTATLTGTNTYNLTNLARGGYNTASAGEASGVPFVRLDNALIQIPFNATQIGNPFYIKLVSFNIYGGGGQDLSSVPAYSYTPTGSSLATPLPNVTGLVNAFVGGFTVLQWQQVSDPRTVDYEIRKGATWATAQVIGRTGALTWSTLGDDTYWVAAHSVPEPGLTVYSATPTSLVITGAILTANVVATTDELATGWTGTLSNVVSQGTGLGLILPSTIASGSYTIPTGHQVNVGRVAPCWINVVMSSRAQYTADDILSNTNVLAESNILLQANASSVSVIPQIQAAPASGIFGPWVNYQPGQYNAQYFNFRILFSNLDPLQLSEAALDTFAFIVNVAARTDTGSAVAIASGGTTITYTAPFNAVPNVQVTILSASAGDDVIMTSSGVSSFHVQVLNGGVGVARSVNWAAQGY